MPVQSEYIETGAVPITETPSPNQANTTPGRNWSAANKLIGPIVSTYRSWPVIFSRRCRLKHPFWRLVTNYVGPFAVTSNLRPHISLVVSPVRLVRTDHQLPQRSTNQHSWETNHFLLECLSRRGDAVITRTMPRVKPGQRRRAKAPKVRTGCRTCKLVNS